jgi:N-acetylmuramoyl-L-alanine amidase
MRIILVAAVVLATLFTAWTPVGLLTSNLTEKIAQALAPRQETGPIATLPTPTPRPDPHIGIVAGHWGNDPGAVCDDGVTEAQINLNIATLVRQNLIGEGFEVDLLEEFDESLDQYQALALVSIHADSCEYINDQATGFKVAAALASANPDRAARLTACLRSRYAQTTGLPYHSTSITPDMTSYHAFDEINPETTAAIIETGFLNLDRQILTQHPDVVAHGISEGILCYIYNEDISAPTAP